MVAPIFGTTTCSQCAGSTWTMPSGPRFTWIFTGPASALELPALRATVSALVAAAYNVTATQVLLSSSSSTTTNSTTLAASTQSEARGGGEGGRGNQAPPSNISQVYLHNATNISLGEIIEVVEIKVTVQLLGVSPPHVHVDAADVSLAFAAADALQQDVEELVRAAVAKFGGTLKGTLGATPAGTLPGSGLFAQDDRRFGSILKSPCYCAFYLVNILALTCENLCQVGVSGLRCGLFPNGTHSSFSKILYKLTLIFNIPNILP